MTDLFVTLKKTKEKDKHIAIVEALVDADLLFVETQEMIYRITNSIFDSATLFARTGKLQTRVNGVEKVYSGSFDELANILKQG